MSSSQEREQLSYEQFGIAIRELATTIADSGYNPTIILSIARGGLLVGGALGYALGVKNAFTMSVEFYLGVDERLPMPVVLPPVPKQVDLAGARVLVADDVADTGATLALVKAFCEGYVAEVRSAVLYEKPDSVEKPEYSWCKTDKWIEFPWSSQPPVIEGGVRDA
ncbi:MAG TPA: phosphoribosyltransferase family protein [Candidatus Nanopelagicaceae bacterium]|nr:phosphoribosyltransferase family protein [Candidatus Nanopelagicaceae bacterium]